VIVFSDKAPRPYVELPATTSSEAFFAQVAGSASHPAILLVGGSDHASWTTRVQQAPMRFDRRPSDFSHAALVCEWDRSAPERSWGLEINLVDVAPSAQRPEHGAVTLFRVADYLDAVRFPNLAVIDVPPPSGASLDAVVEAARTPLRDSLRYPLLRWLAAWRAFLTLPEASPHPLANRTPHPAAALVAMAYEAAELTLVPAATDMQHCPELLWANAKYWRSAVGANVTITRLIRDPEAKVRPAMPTPIEVPKRRSPPGPKPKPKPKRSAKPRRR